MKTIRAWWIPAEDDGDEREYKWPYLNREYGIRLFYGGNQIDYQFQKIKNGERALLVLDNSIKSLDFLKDFPPRSVIVMLVSDEIYSTRLTCGLLCNGSIHSIYRDYPLRGFSGLMKYPRTLTASIFSCIRFKLKISSLLKAFIAGLAMLLKQLTITSFAKILRKQVRQLPLGYTGSFATNFQVDKHLEDDDSFIDFSRKGILNSKFEIKSEETYFSGQRGNFDRQLFLETSRHHGLGIRSIHVSFGGPEKLEEKFSAEKDYFEGLKMSRFSICPSGNYSAESFRFLESLLLQSLPLMPAGILSDPLYRNSFSRSWKLSSHIELKNFPENKRIDFIVRNLEDFYSTRNAIRSDLQNIEYPSQNKKNQ
jgi:hypothetical protein